MDVPELVEQPWIQTAHQDTEMVSDRGLDLSRENERLRRESYILKEEREFQKNRSGLEPACAW